MTDNGPGRRVVTATLALVLAAVVAGCGGDGDSGDDNPASDAPTENPAASPPENPIVIAHRGASADAPEHTFAAFDLALEQDADYLEQDLHLTADGEMVVIHDDTLDRTARGPVESCTGPVSDKTLAQLQECDMGSWFNETYPERANPEYVGLQIPTMEEVLDRYGDTTRYYVELKAFAGVTGMEQPFVDLLVDHGLVDGAAESRQVYVQSFSPDVLAEVHSIAPGLPLVQLFITATAPTDDDAFDAVAEYAVGIGPSRNDVDDTFLAAAHARCLAVHPYTVDDPDEMTRLLDAGVNGMFTNTPGVLREQVTGRPVALGDCTPTAGGG